MKMFAMLIFSIFGCTGGEPIEEESETPIDSGIRNTLSIKIKNFCFQQAVVRIAKNHQDGFSDLYNGIITSNETFFYRQEFPVEQLDLTTQVFVNTRVGGNFAGQDFDYVPETKFYRIVCDQEMGTMKLEGVKESALE